VSEISKEKIKTPVGKFNVGEVITAKVMAINSDERRIGLSIKRLEMDHEQNILSDYVRQYRPSADDHLRGAPPENLQEKLKEE